MQLLSQETICGQHRPHCHLLVHNRFAFRGSRLSTLQATRAAVDAAVNALRTSQSPAAAAMTLTDSGTMVSIQCSVSPETLRAGIPAHARRLSYEYD